MFNSKLSVSLKWLLILSFVITALTSFAGEKADQATVAPAIKIVSNPISRILLYKNGLAYITRNFTLPGSGDYEMKSVPDPVYGTFWLQSDDRIEVLTGTRIENLSLDNKSEMRRALHQLQSGNAIIYHDYRIEDAYLGKDVMVSLNNNSGTSGGNNYFNGIVMKSPSGKLLLKTQRGYIMVSLNDIQNIKSTEITKPKEPTVSTPYMQLKVYSAKNAKTTPVKLNYLGYGITWSPSYQVDLTNPTNLRIELKAIIRNEIEDLTNVECELISGFPALKFSNKPSLLTPGISIEDYLAALDGNSVRLGRVAKRKAYASAFAYQRADKDEEFALGYSGSTPTSTPVNTKSGSGTDLYFKNIGNLTLEKDQTISKQLEFSNASYEKVVEWSIPRNDIRTYNSNASDENRSGEIWDCVKFANPFTFPLTTAPVTFVQNDRFIAEGMSDFVNPQAQTVLKVTKALSLKKSVTEYEDTSKRERITIEKSNRTKHYATCELKIKNFRSEPVKLIIKRTFNGEFIDGERNPKVKALAENMNSYNPVTRISWEIDLANLQEITLKYNYSYIN